jgi:hypothetical protein
MGSIFVKLAEGGLLMKIVKASARMDEIFSVG